VSIHISGLDELAGTKEYVEYGIDYGDEVDFPFDTAEEAQEQIDDSLEHYAKNHLDPEPIEGAVVVSRNVRIERGFWEPSRQSKEPE
jgi:hypothetical protein